jgi:hypothetical protein
VDASPDADPCGVDASPDIDPCADDERPDGEPSTVPSCGSERPAVPREVELSSEPSCGIEPPAVPAVPAVDGAVLPVSLGASAATVRPAANVSTPATIATPVRHPMFLMLSPSSARPA